MYSEGTKTIFMSKHITICRVAFCEECYKQKRPCKQDIFCVIGRTHQKYMVYSVAYWGTRGFTPHIMTITKIDGEYVYFSSYCAIHECGCNITYSEEREKFLIEPTHITTEKLVKSQWNALVQYKNDSDYILH